MEQYYEQNVVNKNIDERTKKTKTLTIAKTVCMIIAIGALLTIILFVTDDNFVLWLGILIVFSMPFIIAAIILGRVNKKNNTEYDYCIDDSAIKVSEIYFRNARKLKYTVPFNSIMSVGVFDSEGYRKVESTAQKKYLAIVNYDDEDAILYILYNTPKGRRMIFLEPDRGFLIALKRSISAITICDKSVADLENRLNKSETQI